MSPDLERLVGRAVMDKAFRDKLLADPESAVREANFKLSEEEMADLEAGVERIKREGTSEQLDQQIEPLANW
ncbi:MAG: Franean1_4349 family RiPP [Anaerolineae bacterium]|nr:Franean1_4349 family RiPP [Anaerolineae bacterium]